MHLIDIGARDGIDSRWQPFHSQIRVTAFEPEPLECELLNAKKWPYKARYLPIALGSENAQEATLYVCKQPGCSSLLRPNAILVSQYPYGSAMEIVTTCPVKLSRLDSVVTDPPDVIKVDTQGTELDILRGAGHLLDHATAVEAEVEFVPQYENQPLFGELDAFMRSKGFTLRGIRRTYWRADAKHAHSFGGQLIHGDALYFRESKLDTPIGHMICAAYRQYDLLAKFGATKLIPTASPVHRLAGKLMSMFVRDNREQRRLIDHLRPATATDWHDPDFF